jgi:hypothetical protein
MPELAATGIGQSLGERILSIHNPDYSWMGFVNTGTATPGAPSENDAYIVEEAGTCFGVASCAIGDVVYYDGSAWQKEALNELGLQYAASFVGTNLLSLRDDFSNGFIGDWIKGVSGDTDPTINADNIEFTTTATIYSGIRRRFTLIEKTYYVRFKAKVVSGTIYDLRVGFPTSAGDYITITPTTSFVEYSGFFTINNAAFDDLYFCVGDGTSSGTTYQIKDLELIEVNQDIFDELITSVQADLTQAEADIDTVEETLVHHSLSDITIGENPNGSGTLASQVCAVDYSVFETEGVLQSVRVRLDTSGDFKLVHLRNTDGDNTWNEIANYDLSGSAGDNTIDVTAENIEVLPNDTFGIYPVTAYPKFKSSIADSQFVNAGSSIGSISFTSSVFPDATGIAGIAMDMQFTLKPGNISDRLTTLEAFTTLNRAINQYDQKYNEYTQIHVKKDGTGDYTDIQTAIDAITDATINKQYEILIHDDWEALTTGDYNNVTGSFNCLFETKDYVHVRGYGSRKKIYGELPTGLTAIDYSNTQVVTFNGNCRMENLEIIAKNIRYPIHSDNASANRNDHKHLIDCRVEHLGCDEVASGERWSTPSAWGGGTATGQRVLIEKCEFISPIYPFSNHTNSDFDNPDIIILKDSKFINTKGGDAINVYDLGSRQHSGVEIINCLLQGKLSQQSSSWYNATDKQEVDNLIVKIKGSGNTPAYYEYGFAGGLVLKITSNTTGNSSSVVIKSGTAKDILFGTNITRKDGGGSLAGFAFGALEIDDTNRGNIDVYSQSLGHRLGDCSVTNKTLVVTVDGVDETVTFDKDYAGGVDLDIAPAFTNAQIIAEIDAALSATASEFALGDDYYPEFTDIVESRANSSTTTEILEGMGVVFVGWNMCRVATEGEAIDGIALDDILPSAISGRLDDRGRILKKAYIHKSTGKSPLWNGATPTLAAGDAVRISSVDGRFEKSATATTAMTAIDTDILSLNI